MVEGGWGLETLEIIEVSVTNVDTFEATLLPKRGDGGLGRLLPARTLTRRGIGECLRFLLNLDLALAFKLFKFLLLIVDASVEVADDSLPGSSLCFSFGSSTFGFGGADALTDFSFDIFFFLNVLEFRSEKSFLLHLPGALRI